MTIRHLKLLISAKKGDQPARNLQAGDVTDNPDGTAEQKIYQVKGNRPVSIIVPIPLSAIETLKKYGIDKMSRKLEINQA